MSIFFFLSPVGTKVSAEAGTVTITGVDATILGGSGVVVPSAGTVAITGVDATIVGGAPVVVPGVGTVVITGVDAQIAGIVPQGGVLVTAITVKPTIRIDKFRVRTRYRIENFVTRP